MCTGKQVDSRRQQEGLGARGMQGAGPYETVYGVVMVSSINLSSVLSPILSEFWHAGTASRCQ